MGRWRRLPAHRLLDQGGDPRAAAPSPSTPRFRELEKESFGRGHAARGPAFADGNHLAEDRLIRRLPMTPTGTAGGIAALAFRKARIPWRSSITDARPVMSSVLSSSIDSHDYSLLLLAPAAGQSRVSAIARAASDLLTIAIGQAMRPCGEAPIEPPKAREGAAPARD